jgi:hypothetical protein
VKVFARCADFFGAGSGVSRYQRCFSLSATIFTSKAFTANGLRYPIGDGRLSDRRQAHVHPFDFMRAALDRSV